MVLLINFMYERTTLYHKYTFFKTKFSLKLAFIGRNKQEKYYEIKSYLWLHVQLLGRNIALAKMYRVNKIQGFMLGG